MYLNSGDPRRAIRHYNRSIVAWERLNPRRGADLTVDTPVAQAWGMMGNALVALGESDAAVERHTAAVNLLRGWMFSTRRFRPRWVRSPYSFTILPALSATPAICPGAVRALEESLRLRRQVIGKDPPTINGRRRLFILNHSLASLHGHSFTLHLGDTARAETYATESLRIAEELAREDKGSDRSVRDLMFGKWLLGCVLLPEHPAGAALS